MNPHPPGIHEEILDSDPSSPRRVTICVPPGHSVTDPTPLVVALHYAIPGDVTPPFYGRGVLEKLAAPAMADLGAVLVAPDAVAGDWTSAASEAVVLDAIESVQEAYRTDPDRVVLIGYSRGGYGAWHLAARHRNRFAAAIPISARPGEAADYRVPIYVIHSVDDELIPIRDVEECVDRLQEAGADVRLHTVSGVTHFDTASFVEPLRGALPWLRSAWD